MSAIREYIQSYLKNNYCAKLEKSDVFARSSEQSHITFRQLLAYAKFVPSIGQSIPDRIMVLDENHYCRYHFRHNQTADDYRDIDFDKKNANKVHSLVYGTEHAVGIPVRWVENHGLTLFESLIDLLSWHCADWFSYCGDTKDGDKVCLLGSAGMASYLKKEFNTGTPIRLDAFGVDLEGEGVYPERGHYVSWLEINRTSGSVNHHVSELILSSEDTMGALTLNMNMPAFRELALTNEDYVSHCWQLLLSPGVLTLSIALEKGEP